MTAIKKLRKRLLNAVPAAAILVGMAIFWSIPAVAQQYLTPSGTDPASNDASVNPPPVKVAPPLNSSSSLQQKAGSLIIGPNGGTAKVCLNASAADLAAYPVTTKCIQSWADVANSIGGPFLKYDSDLSIPPGNAAKTDPSNYPSDPGFIRIQATCAGGNCIDDNRQLYSFLTSAPNAPGIASRGLYASDSGDGASYAAYFSGRLHIHNTIGNGDPLGQLCLNGFGVNCIDEWTDLSLQSIPSNLFLRLQGANPPTSDTGSVSLSGVALLGSAAIDVPLAATATASTCGDGICRVQSVTDATNYETSANCPTDCATIAQLGSLSIPNVGGQYCALNHTTACTISPDTCGANGPCQTSTGEVRITTPTGQLPAGSQVNVIVVRALGAPPSFVPLQGSTYTTDEVFGDSTIIYAGTLNQTPPAIPNSIIERDRITASGTYHYRAYVGNVYPRYGVVYVPIAGDAAITYNQLTVTRSPVAGGVPTSTSPDSQIKCGASPNVFCVGFYKTGSTVTIAPQPNSGYSLSSWTGCTSISGVAPNVVCNVTMNADTSVSATYALSGSTYSLTLNKFGTSRAAVSSTPSGINCGLNCTSDIKSYTSGTVVVLTANPENVDDVVSWAGCNSAAANTCSVNLTGDRSVNLTVNLAGGTPPGGCFVAGTRIDTPTGPRAIDQLKIGDQVMAYDDRTGQTVVSRVTETFVREAISGRVTLSNGTTLGVTAEHRFFDPRAHAWRPISTMRPGDVVLYGYGPAARMVTILAAEFSSRRGPVYNLEVERYHTYYVNGIVVHNKYL